MRTIAPEMASKEHGRETYTSTAADCFDRLVNGAKDHLTVLIERDFNAWTVDSGSQKTNRKKSHSGFCSALISFPSTLVTYHHKRRITFSNKKKTTHGSNHIT